MSQSTNLLKVLISVVITATPFFAFAVVENCDKGVSFSNGNTYKNISGTISCVLRKNPRINTRSVSLRNGKKHGKTIIYGGFYHRKDSARNHIAVIENYSNGKKHGRFIIYDEKTPAKINVEKDYKNGVQQREMRLSPFNGGKTISYYRPKGKWSTKVGSLSYNKAGQLSDKSCPKTASHIAELNKVCGYNNKGSKTQLVTLRDNNGKVKATAFMAQGQNRESKTFYPSGKIRTIKTTGLSQLFYENGELQEKVIDKRDGDLIKISYYPSGVKKSLKRSNQRSNLETRDWYMNGKPKRVEFYQPKTKHTIVKSYYDNGQLSEDFRTAGKGYSSKLIGNFRRYYESGKLWNESRFDKNGRILREKMFFKNGRLMKFTVVNSDKSHTVKEYAKNGNLKKSETYYADGSVKE